MNVDQVTMVVVQCGEIRLVGKVETTLGYSLKDKLKERCPLTLKDVGAVVIMRGAQPGKLGGIEQVKIVNISTLDFCQTPMAEVYVDKYSIAYTIDDLDEEGRKVMEECYERFTARKPSVVTFARLDGLAP